MASLTSFSALLSSTRRSSSRSFSRSRFGLSVICSSFGRTGPRNFPRMISRLPVRTTSVETQARIKRGKLPKGSL